MEPENYKASAMCQPDNTAEACAPMREKPNPERTRQLMGLAEIIAGMVRERTRGRERCRLRQMVEMFLDD